VHDRRTGLAVTTDLDDEGLRRVADGAAALAAAGEPVPGCRLGDPGPARGHDGFDPVVLGLDAPAAGAALLAVAGAHGAFRAGAARTAIASTRGVRAYEQRSFAELRVRRGAPGGRSLELSNVAVGPAGVDPAGLAAEVDELLDGGAGEPVAVAQGEHAVVLGPWAVAEVLRRAAVTFAGPNLHGRMGTRVAATSINLSDSPRYPGTLPRSFDAEGVPRQPVPLIQDGVAHRAVHDATSGASTGHARAPGGLGGPLPEHLVLVGGGAPGLAELAAPLADGLLIPALSFRGSWVIGEPGSAMAEGVRHIRDGEIADPAPNLMVMFEPLELLAAVQDLTTAQRAVSASPLPQDSARTASATLAPGLRAGGGLHVVGAVA
jgi:predicted Zn-dependent protease